MALTKIPRFAIWICSKFNRNEIEQIILGLIEILSNKDHKIKPKDEIKHKYPNYQNFYVDLLNSLLSVLIVLINFTCEMLMVFTQKMVLCL